MRPEYVAVRRPRRSSVAVRTFLARLTRLTWRRTASCGHDGRGGARFHGAGSFFTLWSPEELYRMGAGWEAAQAACRALLAEGGKRKRG